MPGRNPFPSSSLFLAVIADEATVTGFLLTGMGQRNNGLNYMIVNKDTTNQMLE